MHHTGCIPLGVTPGVTPGACVVYFIPVSHAVQTGSVSVMKDRAQGVHPSQSIGKSLRSASHCVSFASTCAAYLGTTMDSEEVKSHTALLSSTH